MATDRLVLRLECPACLVPVPMPTRTAYLPGRVEMHLDTAPMREHLAGHQDERETPMPTRAPRRCTTPGCARTPEPGTAKCRECTRPRARPSPSSQGYGREHERRFRDVVLRRDPACVCSEENHGHHSECGAPSAHADHHPLSKRELVLRGLDDHDPRRGRGLCHSCHSKVTAQHQPGGWNERGPAY